MLIVSLIFLQVIMFAGMIFFLKRIMTNNVTLATKHLEEMNQEYAKKEEDVTRQLDEAKETYQDTITKARQEAEALRSKTVKEASAESENILKMARDKASEIVQQADKTRDRLLLDVDEKIARCAIDKATELIHHTLPEKFLKEVHSQWFADLIGSGFARVERLNIDKNAKEIRIVSAFEIDGDQRKELMKKIKGILGRDVEIAEKVDPKIVAGIVIHIGNLVLDGSLKNRIQEQAKNAKCAIEG